MNSDLNTVVSRLPRLLHLLRGSVLFWAAAAILTAGAEAIPPIISTCAGLVYAVEGAVFLDGARLEPKVTGFPMMESGSELRLDEGQAKVLLNAGAFLSAGDDSALRMIDNRLEDTRIQLLAGVVQVKCSKVFPDNAITVVFQDAHISIAGKGEYRFDTEGGRFLVVRGKASVQTSKAAFELKSGHSILLTDQATQAKVDRPSTSLRSVAASAGKVLVRLPRLMRIPPTASRP